MCVYIPLYILHSLAKLKAPQTEVQPLTPRVWKGEASPLHTRVTPARVVALNIAATMSRVAALSLAALAASATAYTYSVSVLSKGAVPAMSIKKAVGTGYSPCEFTFNPAWFQPSPTLNQSFLMVRASGCPAEYGGAGDHIMMAYCDKDGTCGDLQTTQFPFAAGAEDPRVFLFNGTYYCFIYANGPGQDTVFLYRSATPLVPSSWLLVVSQLPWHRNGCVILREDGLHYVIFGETGALPGIGIATTTDFVTYTILNKTWLEPNGAGDALEPEIVLEAATAPVQLSTGDYLHLYAAGTPGWVANGNYTAGWVVLDQVDPTKIVQRSSEHLFVPTMDYEIGNGIWPVNRNRTIFTTR